MLQERCSIRRVIRGILIGGCTVMLVRGLDELLPRSHLTNCKSASMEYQLVKDPQSLEGREIARKIYETALAKYPGNVELVCQYLQFLIDINDELSE